jgi:hypothetical protein
VDRLQVWAFHVDWTAPASSTFTQVGVIQTAPFDSDMCGGQTNCIPQPGVDILGLPSPPVDALADRLMYRLQYRNVGSYQTLMLNHTVDVDGADRAGIRWYELRTGCATGGAPFCIHQQGTYAPADGNHRWMGSIAMDGAGNIALGFSVASLTTYPSIRYAGQMAGDPLGQLGQEERIVDGTGYQLHSAGRWGDYSSMSVDPTDDCTFWYTQEYYQSVDIWYGANWQTRIASFRFPSCGSGLPALSIDDVTVTEGNAGSATALFTVTRSGPADTEVTVSYATANGSATAGIDYAATSGSLTFAVGQTTQTIPVTVHGDTVYEGDETFLVNLSGASGAVIADGQGVGTIRNDDVAGTISVIAPNGGETLTVGTDVLIRWSSSDVTGNVKIELSRNAGSSYEVLFASTPNDGAETWTVGGKTTSRALIRIRSADAPTIVDTSNGVFSITKSGGKPRGR